MKQRMRVGSKGRGNLIAIWIRGRGKKPKKTLLTLFSLR